MGLEQIGLEAIFKTEAFAKGLASYMQGLGQAEGKTQKSAGFLGKALGAIGAVAGGALAIGATAITGAAVGIAGALAATIGPASDLNETVSKVGVVFGDQAGKVLAFGETAAKSLGMSKNEALAAAGTYGNLFRSMGMTDVASADMSTSLVQLAGDLASFNNMDPGEVLEKLRAGLTGETEPLKSLGVNMSAAQIEAKALSMGLGQTTVDTLKVAEAQNKLDLAVKATIKAKRKYGAESLEAQKAAIAEAKAQEALEKALAGGKTELTAAEKAQASYALIMEQTSLAQGDFERTSGGLANQQRIFAAQMEDLKAKVGTAVLPAVNQLMTALTTFLGSPEIQAGLQQLTQWLATNLPVAIQTASSYWQTVLWPALQQVWAWMNESLFPTLAAVYAWLATNLPPALQALANFWNTVLLPAIQAVWAWMQSSLFPTLQTLWNWLATNVPLAINTLVTVWQTVLLPALQAVWLWMSTVLFPFFAALAGFIGAVFNLVVTAAAGIWQNVLLPALTAVWDFLSANVLPIFQSIGGFIDETFRPVLEWLADFVGNALVGAFRSLTEILKDAINWLESVKRMLQSLKLPAWMTPGSPTPWEVGLVGVNEALKEVTGSLLPLQLQLDRAAASAPSLSAQAAAPTTSSSVTNVSNVFNLGGQNINNGWDAAQLRAFILDTVRSAI